MPRRTFRIGKYSGSYPADIGYLMEPMGAVPSAASRAVLLFHGRSTDASGWHTPPLDVYARALVNAGITVFPIDHARINSWGDADTMRAADDAYLYLQALGYTATKVGVGGHSMGGLGALSWAKRNPGKVSCGWLFSPATDLRFFHDGSGSYTPTYSIGGATQGVYTAEIDTTYGPSTTASGAQTINGSAGPDSTLNVAAGGARAFADGHNNAVTGKPQATSAGTAFTYSGKTDSTLTGCRAVGVTPITVLNNAAIAGTYAGQSIGYQVWQEAAIFAGLGPKFMICQPSDDTIVPPGMNDAGATGFVGRVNHADVQLRSPAPTGGHNGAITPSQVPLREFVKFYLDNLT